MPVLFCKYLRNESLDLHDMVVNYNVVSLSFKYFEDLCTNAHARFIAIARV